MGARLGGTGSGLGLPVDKRGFPLPRVVFSSGQVHERARLRVEEVQDDLARYADHQESGTWSTEHHPDGRNGEYVEVYTAPDDPETARARWSFLQTEYRARELEMRAHFAREEFAAFDDASFSWTAWMIAALLLVRVGPLVRHRKSTAEVTNPNG